MIKVTTIINARKAILKFYKQIDAIFRTSIFSFGSYFRIFQFLNQVFTINRERKIVKLNFKSRHFFKKITLNNKKKTYKKFYSL